MNLHRGLSCLNETGDFAGPFVGRRMRVGILLGDLDTESFRLECSMSMAGISDSVFCVSCFAII